MENKYPIWQYALFALVCMIAVAGFFFGIASIFTNNICGIVLLLVYFWAAITVFLYRNFSIKDKHREVDTVQQLRSRLVDVMEQNRLLQNKIDELKHRGLIE